MNTRIALIALSLLALTGTTFAGLFYYQKTDIETHLAEVVREHEDQRILLLQKIQDAQSELTDSLAILDLTSSEKESLEQSLKEQQEKVDEIEDEYKKINKTVTDLVKLGNTDEELLQKYSRVYFLNENYIPTRLSTIDSDYLYGSKSLQIHADVEPFLNTMIENAEDDDIDLRILSAYRSFNYQQQIKESYLTIYGSGANAFSADQGYSEHQLGSTVDFTTTSNGSSLSLFEGTAEFEWLEDNAYKYGFVLSYPENNSFYQYEPWHWRFVGKDLAKKLHRDDKHFYDLEQRVLDTYLLEMFD